MTAKPRFKYLLLHAAIDHHWALRYHCTSRCYKNGLSKGQTSTYASVGYVGSQAQWEQSCSAVYLMLRSPQECWRRGTNKARGVNKMQNSVGRAHTSQVAVSAEKRGEVLQLECSLLNTRTQKSKPRSTYN